MRKRLLVLGLLSLSLVGCATDIQPTASSAPSNSASTGRTLTGDGSTLVTETPFVQDTSEPDVTCSGSCGDEGRTNAAVPTEAPKVTDVNDTEISVDKPMTAKRLGLQVVALGEFPALNGVLNVPKTAVCRPLEVDDLGLGKYRCSIQFLATDAPMSYLVEVPANGEWRANPS